MIEDVAVACTVSRRVAGLVIIRPNPGGVVRVIVPLLRIREDVLTGAIQLSFVSDDPLVIVPLPELVCGSPVSLIHALGRRGLEGSDYGT
jgi:hypothetical protein